MKRFTSIAATFAIAASSASGVACGRAEAPSVIADAASVDAPASSGVGARAGDGAGAAPTNHHVLPSEAELRARAAVLAPGFNVDRVYEEKSPARVTIERADAGTTCYRVVVVSSDAVDVHLEDSVGPRGKTMAHVTEAALPDDGPLCARTASPILLEAKGAATLRFAVLTAR